MCTGLEIAALVATAAGTGMSIAGTQRAQAAMNDRAEAEMERQKSIQRRGKGVFEASLAQSTRKTAEEQLQEGEKQAGEDYTRVNAAPLSTAIAPPSSIATDSPVQGDRDAAAVALGNTAAGRLSGYTHYDLLQAIKNARANQQLSMLSNFARGSQAVLPYEIQQAQEVGSGLRAGGTVLSTAGLLAGLYGAVQPAATAVGAAPTVSGRALVPAGTGSAVAPAWTSPVGPFTTSQWSWSNPYFFFPR